jgi:hypothetical protein
MEDGHGISPIPHAEQGPFSSSSKRQTCRKAGAQSYGPVKIVLRFCRVARLPNGWAGKIVLQAPEGSRARAWLPAMLVSTMGGPMHRASPELLLVTTNKPTINLLQSG